MTIVEAAVLGLIQGLTEFIPVSSSGHLVLLHQYFGSSSQDLAFDVALHVGTLLAVIVFFWKDILTLLAGMFKRTKEQRLVLLLIAATIPAGIAGLTMGDWVEKTLRQPRVVAAALVFGSVLMFLADYYSKWQKGKAEHKLTFSGALLVGGAQASALIPGMSRSGMSMVGGLLAGLSRKAATRFAFLLSIPIISLSAIGTAYQKGLGEIHAANFMVGLVVSFVAGLLAIKFMLKYLAKHGLSTFAWYRLILAVAVVFWLV
jgi:undecaprenyl-diphosphatase